MRDGEFLILNGNEVQALLSDRELELIEAVRRAYVAHGAGSSTLPHSTFLRFPEEQRNRIIALPAYLGDEFAVAGIKWVSSFPANLEKGLDRASAVVILNSTLTGRPEAIIEGSIINAKRTAASAALAAQCLLNGERVTRAGILGAGLINFEIVRFLLAILPDLTTIDVLDLDQGRANHFKEKCRAAFPNLKVDKVTDLDALLKNSRLVSMATTAARPHISDISACPRGSTVLHISLRDLSPEVILSCDNVVDDAGHVCRAQTSLHLAEQLSGKRDFIRCSLPEILRGVAPAKPDPDSVTVFSPFGVGVLDIAVGKLVRDLGIQQGYGTVINSFFPDSWSNGNHLSVP
jgi:ornithine cyclodeaminase